MRAWTSTVKYGWSSPGRATVRDTGFETTGTSAGVWPNATAANASPAILRMLIISTFRIHGIQRHRPDGGAALQDRIDRGKHAERREGREDEAADDGAAERGRLGAALARADRHRQHAADHRGG